MKYSTLFLHVGWSKTGTSAIQAQVQDQHKDFLHNGILYPQSLQWPDHSHHPFALSFNNISGYEGQHTPAEALEKLRAEMALAKAESVLISSELSPFYFANQDFKTFVDTHFDTVKVIFTVRTQSELLLSLFNQLIKDPNVRYGSSLFTLAMRNLEWLNFDRSVGRWETVVGQNNLDIIPYSKEVVKDFFDIFSIEQSQEKAAGLVNPSLPTRALALLQARGRQAKTAADYATIRKRLLDQIGEVPTDQDRLVLFSVPEQKSFDDHFASSNQRLAERFGVDLSKIHKSSYSPVKVLPAAIKLPSD